MPQQLQKAFTAQLTPSLELAGAVAVSAAAVAGRTHAAQLPNAYPHRASVLNSASPLHARHAPIKRRNKYTPRKTIVFFFCRERLRRESAAQRSKDTLCTHASYRRRHLTCTAQMRPTLACAAGVAAAAATSCSAFSLSHFSSGSAAARARRDMSVTAVSPPLPGKPSQGC